LQIALNQICDSSECKAKLLTQGQTQTKTKEILISFLSTTKISEAETTHPGSNSSGKSYAKILPAEIQEH